MGKGLPGEKVLFFESPDSSGEGATFTVCHKGMLTICVEDESAVDSYNQVFESYAKLSRTEALKLRDWLSEMFDEEGR